MKISQAISKLKAIQDIEGDLECYAQDLDTGDYYPTDAIRATIVPRKHDTPIEPPKSVVVYRKRKVKGQTIYTIEVLEKGVVLT